MSILLSRDNLDMTTAGMFLIRVQGFVSTDWLDYFDDLSIIVSAPQDARPISTVCTHHADQAELLGLLTRLYTFGYPILSLEYLGVI